MMQGADLRRPGLLVLASTYPRWPGDPEPGFVHHLSSRLAAEFEVVVVCPHSPGAAVAEALDGVQVIRYRYAPARLETLVNDGGVVSNLRRARWKLGLVPAFILAQAWTAWRLLRSGRFDVVHAHWLVPQGMIMGFLRRAGVPTPYVVTSHGADLHALRGGFWDAARRFVVRHATSTTVVSTAMRPLVAAAGKEPLVMPMGVDMRGLFTPPLADQRQAYEILFVGRMVEKKGLRHLIEAFARVKRVFPLATLNIAGFGPEEQDRRAQVKALGLGGSISFLGAVRQEDLPDLYRHAALLVAPFVEAKNGDREGLGLVVVEAISCGCPVVVGDVPAVGEVFAGIEPPDIVEPRDVQALSAVIMEVLSNPVAKRAAAARMREALLARFDWGVVAARYSGLLRQAMTQAANAPGE